MEQNSKFKILVIEDDRELQEVLTLLLKPHYSVQCASDGMEGVKMALRTSPDLILLDIKMPNMDGFQTCQLIRSDPEFDKTPILVLSGYGGENDRTRALECGADDFIAKPFSSPELLARIKRRVQVSEKKETARDSLGGHLSFADLRLELFSGKAFIGEEEIHFSQIEFRLLQLLMENAGNLVSRETILEKIWSNNAPSNRVIDPHIVSIRDKLSKSAVSVSSIYGKGYVLKLNS